MLVVDTHFSYVSCIGYMLSNCLNAKKKYISNTKYTIQHNTERSQTIKCSQYNIYDTKSCELPNYCHMFLKSCIGFVLSNCLNAKKSAFGIRNSQYSIALNIHKQPIVFNTTYAIQSRVNCQNYCIRSCNS